MFEYLDQQRAAADATVKPWQQDLKAGDFAMAYSDDAETWIFYQIPDPVEEERKCLEDGEDDEESLEYIRDLYSQPHMKNYRFTKAFSELCPDGEFGDVHISTITLCMKAEEFELARRCEWNMERLAAESEKTA